MPVWRRRYLRLWRAGALFLVEGNASREQLLRLGCPPEKARVHHLGIPLARYPWRARALAPDEPLRLLTVGRFSEKKGIPDAVRAVARLVRAGERVQLTVIGDSNGSPEGEREKGRIFEAIGVERVQAHVRLLGMQPRALVDRAYYDHHVLIAASFEASDGENEGGFPVTLTEAAASGMPIIATRHCDIPEIVQDGRTGFLAPERDVAQLARHVQTFRDDPGLLEGMGRAGHEHATGSYDARAQADALDALYADLIG
jgi:colanic acid/amylovoran biosynthesis glycosyltransferase